MLTDEEAVDLVRSHIEKQFPRSCTKCGRTFPTLAAFVLETSRVGEPLSTDAEDGEWRPTTDDGAMAMANCPCGTTLAIDSAGIGLGNMWKLLAWARARSRERGVSVRALMSWMRDEIDARVIGSQESRDG